MTSLYHVFERFTNSQYNAIKLCVPKNSKRLLIFRGEISISFSRDSLLLYSTIFRIDFSTRLAFQSLCQVHFPFIIKSHNSQLSCRCVQFISPNLIYFIRCNCTLSKLVNNDFSTLINWRRRFGNMRNTNTSAGRRGILKRKNRTAARKEKKNQQNLKTFCK